MTKNKYITLGIIIGVTVIMIGYDIWAAVNGIPGDTESRVLLELSLKHFTIPFSFGTLGGHFFWPRSKPIITLWGISRLWLVLGVLLVASILDVFFVLPPQTLPFIPILGYLFGHFFWPQNPNSEGL